MAECGDKDPSAQTFVDQLLGDGYVVLTPGENEGATNSPADPMAAQAAEVPPPGTEVPPPGTGSSGDDTAAPPGCKTAVESAEPKVESSQIVTVGTGARAYTIALENAAVVAAKASDQFNAAAVKARKTANTQRHNLYRGDPDYAPTADMEKNRYKVPDNILPLYTYTQVGSHVTSFPIRELTLLLIGQYPQKTFKATVLGWQEASKDDPKNSYEQLQKWRMEANARVADELYDQGPHSARFWDLVCATSRPFEPTKPRHIDVDNQEINYVFKLLFQRTKKDTAVAVKALEIYHALLSTPRGMTDLYGGQAYGYAMVDAISFLADFAVDPTQDVSRKLGALKTEWASNPLAEDLGNFSTTIEGLMVEILFAVPGCFFTHPNVVEYVAAAIEWAGLVGYGPFLTREMDELISLGAVMLHYGTPSIRSMVPSSAQALDLIDLANAVWNEVLRPDSDGVGGSRGDNATYQYNRMLIHRPGKTEPDEHDPSWWQSEAREQSATALSNPCRLGVTSVEGCDYGPVLLWFRGASALWGRWVTACGIRDIYRSAQRHKDRDAGNRAIATTLGPEYKVPQTWPPSPDGKTLGPIDERTDCVLKKYPEVKVTFEGGDPDPLRLAEYWVPKNPETL